MKRWQVYLTGGDMTGWALDADIAILKSSIRDIVDFVPIAESQIIHTVFWESLLRINANDLNAKRLICQMSGDPLRYFENPVFSSILEKVGCWISQSKKAQSQLDALGISNFYVPYSISIADYFPIEKTSADVARVRKQFGIPEGAYLIGNFHRDTEGSDLVSPKLVKAPDLFLECVNHLWQSNLNIHVVLAGPRRHWLRNKLNERGIPFTYCGTEIAGDDLSENTMAASTLNLLYNLIDLYIVSSRSEGGPRTLLEASAAKCKVISTDVGLARDVLEPECIYCNPIEAIEIIKQDIGNSYLSGFLEAHYERIAKYHSGSYAAKRLRTLYENAENISPYVSDHTVATEERGPFRKALDKLLNRFRVKAKCKLTISIWHKAVKPPYGGGNQFTIALAKSLRKFGCKIRFNVLGRRTDAYLLNSIHFDVDSFRKLARHHRLPIVHRIDGPIIFSRGDRKYDDQCFKINHELASNTVIQSAWTFNSIYEMGYFPVRPVIIRNAADPSIFHPKGRSSFDAARKVKLVATSWSDNDLKGGPVYRWMDQNLDWNKYEFTFVGRISGSFENIKVLSPVDSNALSDILRTQDIYITASRYESCSNALIEALSCGLPALYYNNSSNPEIVGYGGLPFDSELDIASQLKLLVSYYEIFQNLIVVPKLHEVAAKYLQTAALAKRLV